MAVTNTDYWIIGLITWLAPVFFALPAILVLGDSANGTGVAALDMVLVYSGMMVLAPFVGIITVPLALIVGMQALRLGWAGWAMALGVSVLGPIAIGALYQVFDPTAAAVGAMLALSPVFVVHGLVLWVATRLIRPEALLLPEGPTAAPPQVE